MFYGTVPTGFSPFPHVFLDTIVAPSIRWFIHLNITAYFGTKAIYRALFVFVFPVLGILVFSERDVYIHIYFFLNSSYNRSNYPAFVLLLAVVVG